jgi:hypothetical protein
LRSSLAWAGFFLLILLLQTPIAASTRTVGVGPGDRLVYYYHVHNSYINDTSDANVTTDLYWNLTINVQSVNQSSRLPDIGYQIEEDSIHQGKVANTYSENNLTTVFDPFDTGTYLGNLGFPAFMFTDVVAGIRSFGFNVPTNSLPPWATTNSTELPQNVTVSVKKSPSLIYVGLRDDLLNGTATFMTAGLTYNSTTGVMISSAMYTVLSGVYKNFFYTLLSFGRVSSFNYTYVVLAAGVGVVIVAAAFSFVKRPSRKQRKIDRMRRK